MSASGYVLWFIATAVFISCLLGLGIVAATGYWSREERQARAAARRALQDAAARSGRPQRHGRHHRHHRRHHAPVH
jgi:uncharacterized membrane protein YebE (DUF533 family)